MSIPLGVCLPQFSDDPQRTLDVARDAEELGYASVSLFDHLTPLGGPPSRPILECFTMLTAVASVTARIRLLPLVARATLRPPATLGSMVRSLDRLTDGRFVLGLGAGDELSEDENTSIGLPALTSDQRHDAMRAATAATRQLAPEVSVWFGGTGRHLIELAGELADGWNVWGARPDEVRAGVDRVARSATSAGRPMPYVSWGGNVAVAETAADAADRLATWGAGRSAAETARVLSGDLATVAARIDELAAAGVQECLLSFVGGHVAEQRRLLAGR